MNNALIEKIPELAGQISQPHKFTSFFKVNGIPQRMIANYLGISSATMSLYSLGLQKMPARHEQKLEILVEKIKAASAKKI